MAHIYEDIGILTGFDGVMTHQIPRAVEAMDPWLRSMVTDARFWDDKYDPSHVGEFAIEPMTADESTAMFTAYGKMPNPLAGKEVIAVQV